MLSAFTARPIVELRQRDKFKIESILAYGDRLLVGLSTGSLRIYRVNELPEESAKQNGSAKPDAKSDDKPPSRPTSSSAPKPVDLLREVEKFSTRAIDQLAIIKEANVLISLSNSYISIHDLGSYTLQEQLVKTKSASTFAVTSNIVKDSATGIPEIISRLAVAVKRRLLLWSWHESELEHDVLEITLSDTIKTLTWASATKIICGMNSGYVIVDVISQQIEDIVGPGAIGGAAGAQAGRFGGVGSASMGYMGLGSYIPKPLATKLADGEMLLAKDINSLFITAEGKPLEKRQLPWAQSPDAIGYSYPYILALQSPSQGTLEVRNPDTLSLLQSISLPSAKQLHFPPPTVSLAHAGKGFHVASERCIWRMGSTDYDSQIDELVEKERYDEAISVLNMLEDALLRNKEERLREIKILKAQMLFDQRKYQDAVDIFMAKDVQAPPERVIKLFPRVIAGDLTILDEKDHGSESEHEATEACANGDHSGESKTEATGSPKVAAVNKLLKAQVKNSDTSSIRSFMRLDGEEPSDLSSTKSKATEDLPLEGKDLTTAVLALSGFLVQARNRMKAFLDAETGKLKPLEQNGQNGSSQNAFELLLTAPASDAEKDREQKLRDTAKLIDTTLFRAYMLARPQLAGSLFRLPNFCDPDVVNEKLLENGRFNDLVDFFHGKKLHRPALELLKRFGQGEDSEEGPAALKGPQRTVGYLQNLPPEMIDLILEYADWPLRVDPTLGMEIFLADTENAETLPRDRVVNFLQGIDVNLAVKYLEHVINELSDLTPEFHNRLVDAYVQELRGRQDKDSEDWKGLMGRLIEFLRSSKQYSLSKAFGLIPRDDPSFYEAQAVVLSNMGQHKQALEIYVFKIQDFEKAEEYCNHIHLTTDSATASPDQTRRGSTSTQDDDTSTPSIYHTLLSLYLTPPPPHKPNWPPALDLLSKHGSRLPASSTLNLIPTTLPVGELESYFRGRIRAANSIVNETRVVSGLRKSEVVSAQAGLLLGDGAPNGKGGRNRRVVVSDERVCGVCHKRIGRSVIAVLPDNEVVHYGCLNRVGNRPGSGGGMAGLRAAGWGRS
ncbi:Vacuolar morphogenesis protein 6 [Cadophora gregata]|uniref:Vacuolar morphogenesis protein 6 n=1 Tax=Cadophora gregata TaxID=51156 RepID=UPI0026DAA036|nr:Vacuolar morphogenesis protein 6 [Cadophora gregata]KAK0100762.1 Vacuolar morphogenesis protein 6 [Cadophora gregata]